MAISAKHRSKFAPLTGNADFSVWVKKISSVTINPILSNQCFVVYLSNILIYIRFLVTQVTYYNGLASLVIRGASSFHIFSRTDGHIQIIKGMQYLS